MTYVSLVLRGWAVGFGMAAVWAWITLGALDAAQALLRAVVPSLAGFSAIALLVYVPGLRAVAGVRGQISALAAAIVCVLLGAVVVAIIAFAYDGSRWWVMGPEKGFMFLLLAVPGAVFGGGWAHARNLR